MNIYGRQVKQLLNCTDEYAQFIVAAMAADGFDFSESSQKEFDESARLQDSLVASGFVGIEPKKPTITVRVTQNYGCRAVYPVCNEAKIFADIAGTKTLKPQTIDLIKKLGYVISVEKETV